MINLSFTALGIVTALAFSPDGGLLVAGWGSDVVLISVPKREIIRVLRCRVPLVNAVAFHPDGKTFASGGHDGIVRIWRASDGQLVDEMPNSDGNAAIRGSRINDLDFHPEGVLVAGGTDGVVRMWHDGRRILTDLPRQPGEISAVAFSRDGSSLATGGAEGVLIRPFDRGGDVARAFDYLPIAAETMAFSFDGTKIAIGSGHEAGRIEVWNTAERFRIASIPGHQGGVRCLVFSCDDEHVFSAGEDGIVLKSRIESTTQQATIGRYQQPVRALAIAPTANCLVSGGTSVDLRDSDGGEVLAAMVGPTESVGGAAFSLDGLSIAVGSALMPVRLWSVSQAQSVSTWEGPSERTRAICSNPVSDEFAFADADGVVRIWREVDGSARTVEELSHRQRIEVIRYSPDGLMLAVAGIGPTIWVWNTQDRRLETRLSAHENWILGLEFCPESSSLASGGDDGYVRLWQLSDHQLIAESQAHEHGVRCVDFSPDGALLASAGAEPVVRLWNRSGGLVRELACDAGLSMCLAFHPVDEVLAVGDAENIQLVDLWSRRRVALLMGHVGWVIGLLWNRDGSVLASIDNCGYVKLWKASGELVASLTSLPESGWASISADGEVKLDGDPGNHFWWAAKMWRFGLGELGALRARL
jgi:WD40 repeat protein